jgi:hypothetical protein
VRNIPDRVTNFCPAAPFHHIADSKPWKSRGTRYVLLPSRAPDIWNIWPGKERNRVVRRERLILFIKSVSLECSTPDDACLLTLASHVAKYDEQDSTGLH